jgi:hypothetical protein
LVKLYEDSGDSPTSFLIENVVVALLNLSLNGTGAGGDVRAAWAEAGAVGEAFGT